MNEQHTPGPWVQGNAKSWDRTMGIYKGDNRIIDCDPPFSSHIEKPEKTANARLVAAAPDLLQALSDLVFETERKLEQGDSYKFDSTNWFDLLQQANSAIERATIPMNEPIRIETADGYIQTDGASIVSVNNKTGTVSYGWIAKMNNVPRVPFTSAELRITNPMNEPLKKGDFVQVSETADTICRGKIGVLDLPANQYRPYLKPDTWAILFGDALYMPFNESDLTRL